MRVFLDEGVPRHSANALRDVGLAADRFRKEWAQLSNGALIRAVEAEGYEILPINDKNIAHQRNLKDRKLAIVALPLNRRSIVMARVDDIADTIRRAKPGQHVSIGLDGTRRATSFLAGRLFTEDLPRVPAFDPRP